MPRETVSWVSVHPLGPCVYLFRRYAGRTITYSYDQVHWSRSQAQAWQQADHHTLAYVTEGETA